MAIRIVLIDDKRNEISRLRLSEDALDGYEILEFNDAHYLYAGLDKGWYVFRRVKSYVVGNEDTV